VSISIYSYEVVVKTECNDPSEVHEVIMRNLEGIREDLDEETIVSVYQVDPAYRGSHFRTTALRPPSLNGLQGTVHACHRNGRSSVVSPARRSAQALSSHRMACGHCASSPAPMGRRPP
jgi:hypothetical protein